MLFVLSSSWEGLPTVLIEALACGTRVVSTDCPSGPSEILENGKWGELVPVNNPEQLALGILRSVTKTKDEQLAKRLHVFSINYSTEYYLKILQLSQPE